MSEGRKDDKGKIRTDLLPFDALEKVSEVLEHGSRKYDARNWEQGMAWGRLLGAALRHLFSWAGGQEKDPESGLPHLSHAACCVLMLLALTMRGVGADDRTKRSNVASCPTEHKPNRETEKALFDNAFIATKTYNDWP